MDLFDAIDLSRQDFFEDSRLGCPLPQVDIGDSLLFQDALLFSPRPYQQSEQTPNLAELTPGISISPTSIDLPCVDDTNHLEDFLGNRPDPSFEESLFQLQKPDPEVEEIPQQPLTYEPIDATTLEPLLAFLVQNASANTQQTSKAVCTQFPQLSDNSMVYTLVDKFAKLKKTKQQLIKYCMRKAFKFVLELPKNDHLLIEQKDRLSFSKGKSRFLRKVSEEKSMNSKFLAQVFSQTDFSQDYRLFLQQFQNIMADDNQKKLKYLASLLTHGKDNQQGNAEMVRRLPWTRPILQKVLKIARELLKFSPAL